MPAHTAIMPNTQCEYPDSIMNCENIMTEADLWVWKGEILTKNKLMQFQH